MYTPSTQILERYADILVNFALGGGTGIKAGEVVLLCVPECARPMLQPLHDAVLRSGGHPIVDIIPDGLQRSFFQHANDAQIEYRPMKRLLGTVEDCDHRLYMIAEHEKYELAGIDGGKVMNRFKTIKPYREAMQKKENEGKFTWTLALYGTQAMAAFAGMSLEEYWNEIIHACFLDNDEPIKRWQETETTLHTLTQKLTDMEIEWVHVVGEDVDLKVKIGEKRKWLGGSGRNIPSFEVFTSPDWRGTNGWIRYNMPLSYQSNIIKGIRLEFKDGLVVNATASDNEKLLKEMISQKDANKAGEFSLTDRRLSRITKFMGETLYDENVGGPFGNTHIALGMAYKDAYTGDVANTTLEEWERLGYNDSVVHTDMMSTTNRTVTATLKDGSEKVIYKDGEFTI
ncbi:aminopeptidase [Candidatus Gracilibacteria bacterium]|nr:aminopeptidase [Candidatus Gracilibacteria bacterium]